MTSIYIVRGYSGSGYDGDENEWPVRAVRTLERAQALVHQLTEEAKPWIDEFKHQGPPEYRSYKDINPILLNTNPPNDPHIIKAEDIWYYFFEVELED